MGTNATRCSPTPSRSCAGCRRRGLGSPPPRRAGSAPASVPPVLHRHGPHAPVRNRSRSARCRSRCRGSRAAWWRGAAGPGTPPSTVTRSRPCSRPRARRRRGGSATPRSRCRAAAPPTRSRCPSATCSAGSSPPAPGSPTTSRRACAGWVASRSGRSSSPARGAMVPLLRQRRRRSGTAERVRSASYSVRWTPALIDADALQAAGRRDARQRARRRPEGRRARTHPFRAHGHGRRDLSRQRAPDRSSRAAAASSAPRTDVTEAFLARLDGSAFDAPLRRRRRARRARVEDWAPIGDERARGDDRAARSTRSWRRVAARVFASGASGSLGADRAARSSTPARTGATSRTSSTRLERMRARAAAPGRYPPRSGRAERRTRRGS